MALFGLTLHGSGCYVSIVILNLSQRLRPVGRIGRAHSGNFARWGFLVSPIFSVAVWLVLGGCSVSPSAWSVAVFHGRTLLDWELPKSASLSCNLIFHGKSCSLADPFIIRRGGLWYLFFELIPPGEKVGKIAVASSSDTKEWKYLGVVLDEPFHLSYPYVFESAGEYYMIPESRQSGAIRLYHTNSFPTGWKFERELITGDYADPSILFYDHRWWILAVKGGYSLAVFFADTLAGPWHEHPQSPLFQGDKGRSRPGGRLIVTPEGVMRFAQDNREGYGKKLRGFLITKLTPTEYEEREVEQSPLLKGGGRGWRAVGMHQFDAQPVRDSAGSGWMITVDGYGYP